MRILARGGYSDCPGPIVVQVAHFVGEPLALVWCHSAVVVDYDVVGRRHGALVHLLRDYQEVVPEKRRLEMYEDDVNAFDTKEEELERYLFRN